MDDKKEIMLGSGGPMKKTAFIIVLTCVFVLMSGFGEATDQTDLDARIKKIASYLDRPEGPGEDGKLMVTLLLEAILEAAPDTGFPPEFAENMEKAKGISDSTSVLNPEGIVYLHKAYRLVNSGNDFEMPGSIKEIQDAVNYIRIELASARKSLKVGKMDACVKILLEVTLMIVTPVYR
jgi:hypothetical protein